MRSFAFLIGCERCAEDKMSWKIKTMVEIPDWCMAFAKITPSTIHNLHCILKVIKPKKKSKSVDAVVWLRNWVFV